MPEQLYFPRRRFFIMQSILWIVLGTTVGVAALLDRHLLHKNSLDFGDKLIHDGLGYAIPVGWKGSWTTGPANVAIFTATENTLSAANRRTITIVQQHLPRMMSPTEYLATAAPPGMTMSIVHPDWGSIDNWPAIQFAGEKRGFGRFNRGQDSEIIGWCAVLPDKEAIIIRIDRTGGLDPQADTRLMDKLMEVMDLPPGLQQDKIDHFDFTDGSKVEIPKYAMVCSHPDPLSSDRTILWRESDDDPQLMAWEQFIPVELAADDPASLRQALSISDGTDPNSLDHSYRWLSATVSDLGNHRWKIDASDPTNGSLMRCAYLIGGSGSRGILDVISGVGVAPAESIAAAWAATQNQIHPANADDRASLLQTGTALATNAHSVSVEDQFWLLQRAKTPIGWIHLNAGNSSTSERNSVLRNPDGTYTRTTYTCDLTRGADDISTSTIRKDDEGLPRTHFNELFNQATNISDKISVSIRMFGGPTPMDTVDRPQPFVPGAILPGLLSRITHPALVWTDRVIGYDGEIMAEPAMVLLQPIPNSESELRGVEMEINGVGQLSNWYFHTDDGTLEHADFAGDKHLTPATRKQILDTFSGDSRLTPIPAQ
jgi:hypothetical protein